MQLIYFYIRLNWSNWYNFNGLFCNWIQFIWFYSQRLCVWCTVFFQSVTVSRSIVGSKLNMTKLMSQENRYKTPCTNRVHSHSSHFFLSSGFQINLLDFTFFFFRASQILNYWDFKFDAFLYMLYLHGLYWMIYCCGVDPLHCVHTRLHTCIRTKKPRESLNQ